VTGHVGPSPDQLQAAIARQSFVAAAVAHLLSFDTEWVGVRHRTAA